MTNTHFPLQGLATRLLCACLLLLFLFTSLAFGQVTSAIVNARIAELILKADQHRLNGNNAEALKLLNQAIWFDGNCGQCFAFRSGVLGNLQRFKEGYSDGDIGVKKSTKPRDKALAAYNMGYNLEGLNRRAEADSVYRQCIEYDPSLPMCYFGKGKNLVGMEVYREALTALHTATTLHPKHGPSWSYRAEAEGALGLLSASLLSGSNAVELAPKEARSYLARAYANGLNRKFEEMLADATRAVEIDPQRPRAHLMRGQALRFLGRNEEAEREFDLEPDRKAVANALHPEKKVDLRIYNCGNEATDIQTPANFNAEGFNACKDRVLQQLIDSAKEADTPSKPKTIPGFKSPVPEKK